MNIPAELKYTKSHEWLKAEADGSYAIGLTDYAQKQLGDIVFINLPAEGDTVTAGEAMADVESVKAVSDVFSPVTGTIAAVNEDLMDEPQQMNQAPYDAWIAKIGDVTATEELLSAKEYETFCSSAKE
ncbi:glycine cleavage system protein GcvH [uncultured Gemmiger sp.]|uniref:glycine cleavage system protein GcvH n=1 Tax=uncultured Gemmiger sp. TaxID=1623490 RepID=UPI0025E56893|nr:glycine cleavage system protein GcvH [uncultured Gemmiger sp.]